MRCDWVVGEGKLVKLFVGVVFGLPGFEKLCESVLFGLDAGNFSLS